ncbi:MAG: EamA family transporter RarD [Ilumatobacter sp.]|uniref:EamA family transporter RarD n=1 Tax=Ilumatobacter sp. TaxID=1967498 RepID=UPI002615E2A9|nr:EamA family transporter RarD [Ilumatobacter sp.]MDJ0770008.1 EamA family transporter RarD [Ilumatobacter sp.]
MGNDQLRGLQAAVLAYTIWGLLTIYWKQLTGLDAVELIGWRLSTATVFMVAILSVTGRWQAVRAAFTERSTVLRIVLASVLLTLNWTTYVWAVVNDRVIETALGYFLAPLGTMALGVVVLGERMTPLKRVSVAFALVAVVVLTVANDRVPWVALALAATWSWYGLTKRRVPLDPVESLTSELIVLVLPAVALVAGGWLRADGIPDQAAGADWAFLIGTGAITAIPLLLFAFAAKRVPFTLLGPTNYLVPIINFLLGWLAFDEPLSPSRVAGFVLVWIALMLVTTDMLRARRDSDAAAQPTTIPTRAAG